MGRKIKLEQKAWRKSRKSCSDAMVKTSYSPFLTPSFLLPSLFSPLSLPSFLVSLSLSFHLYVYLLLHISLFLSHLSLPFLSSFTLPISISSCDSLRSLFLSFVFLSTSFLPCFTSLSLLSPFSSVSL